MSTETSRRILGPFNRVEGDLEVRIEVEDGYIHKAWVNSPLFRGFEQILHGKPPQDALVYTPRICGICSVSQSIAAAQAIAACQGIQTNPNGELASNLILATENLADHLTHFYLFFMPDFARDHYKKSEWFEKIHSRFKAQTGSAMPEVLKARAELLHITGLLAGKWPHSLAIQPGGTTRAVETQEKIRLSMHIAAFRHFLQTTLFHDQLENIAAITTADELLEWASHHANSDFALFIELAQQLELEQTGRASDNFMSYGAYQNNNNFLFARGISLQTNNHEILELDPDAIREDSSYSYLDMQSDPKHPYQGSTIASTENTDGYTWCKAPRLDGKVMEVGAIARQIINQHPLIQYLVAQQGGNVYSRIVSRLLELALVVPAMENWTQQLQPKMAFCENGSIPDEAQGAGMIEAARGSLGHWLRIKNGHILNYQIIAPTTWNFSPRDSLENPGALELALQGTYIGDDKKASLQIQHIIRSFDPCMVCTVH